ncbi:hypothetical protein FXO37_34653 [Capsicum annuum]|nr:hypothetical protein FXO37_34653 [Capsicum annuum]
MKSFPKNLISTFQKTFILKNAPFQQPPEPQALPPPSWNLLHLASTVLAIGSKIQILMAEDNSDELASPVTSVKNDSATEDNTNELDNINELVSLVTSMKNDSSGSKPDKISTIKSRSVSNGNKLRQSTGKLNSPDSEQDVLPHYLRAFTSSCHDFCKYGRKHSSEGKPWHPLSKRKNKLPADEQSLTRTLAEDAKNGTLAKQKPFNPPGSVLGEKKKVIEIGQKIVHLLTKAAKQRWHVWWNSVKEMGIF